MTRSDPRDPAYRRALATVVVLNLGYGLLEGLGGLLADSQALQADALDFLGDGLITLLGWASIAWPRARRARVALLQGAFLGALGLGVLGHTAWRVVVPHQPVAEAMGVLASGALMVNLLAAALLVPHRQGDATMRAVWLFSRNDAIGNLLVLVAAALVALTGTPWPDLVVGAFVALLFLQGSMTIIGRARQELGRASADGGGVGEGSL